MMKNTFLKILSIGVLVSMSSAVIAAKGSSTTIDFMQSASNGNVFVAFESGSMPGCYENRGGLISKETADGYKSIYATLLAAKMANKEVTPIFSVVGSDQSRWGRCEIKAIFLD